MSSSDHDVASSADAVTASVDPAGATARPAPLAQSVPVPPAPVLLTPGLRLAGLAPNEPATIVATDAATYPCATEVVYRTDSGATNTVMVPDDPDHPTRRGLWPLNTDADGATTSRLPFDADAREFLLASEALRIKYAALYDPMSAVSSSTVQPLPHQIRAVYEEMLPRIPLRFLLADDPGAGKTIMAGLYIKELILRDACRSAIIVVPGSLADQWQAELSEKFDLSFEIFDPATMGFAPANLHEATPEPPNPDSHPDLAPHPYLIARMDQLARSPELLDQLRLAHWDVAVVDEAHRMSAHFVSRDKTRKTRRFRLGRILSHTAENFLLMTATPHAGKPEDYDLFLTLLDNDRFEGVHRGGAHRSDTKGLMRRLVKEDLLTFQGTPLFPQRFAHTVSYELSPAEHALYEDVTAYVSEQMGRADWIAAHGNKRRGNTVGFALTVLQRRLASSPEAILRSLERRRDRLSSRIDEGDAHPWSNGSAGEAGFSRAWAMDERRLEFSKCLSWPQ